MATKSFRDPRFSKWLKSKGETMTIIPHPPKNCLTKNPPDVPNTACHFRTFVKKPTWRYREGGYAHNGAPKVALRYRECGFLVPDGHPNEQTPNVSLRPLVRLV